MVTTRRKSGRFSSNIEQPIYADSSSEKDDSEEYEYPDAVKNVEETEDDEYKGRDEGTFSLHTCYELMGFNTLKKVTLPGKGEKRKLSRGLQKKSPKCPS